MLAWLLELCNILFLRPVSPVCFLWQAKKLNFWLSNHHHNRESKKFLAWPDGRMAQTKADERTKHFAIRRSHARPVCPDVHCSAGWHWLRWLMLYVFTWLLYQWLVEQDCHSQPYKYYVSISIDSRYYRKETQCSCLLQDTKCVHPLKHLYTMSHPWHDEVTCADFPWINHWQRKEAKDM